MTLSLEGVRKVYPTGYQAVHNLDLQVRDGEFVTLLGPSGCGKTTTLRMIAGLEMPSSGRISINGRDYTRTHPRDRDVAMVFQNYALYPHMTVRENLVLNLEVKRMPKAEIGQQVRDVSRMLDIERLLDSKPGQLSGGQRQRVALGRALIRRPNIFLMDEPLSNLDLKLRERTRTELKKLHERLCVATVYVTHDQAEALVLSDRIGIMNGGNLLQVGTPQDVYDRPSEIFTAKFVGTPSINLLAVEAEVDDSGHLSPRLAATGRPLLGADLPAEQEVALRLRKAGCKAILGVRPEAVAVLHEPSPSAVPGRIVVIEPMGSVNHIVLELEGQEDVTSDGEPFIAVVRSNKAFEQGMPVWLAIRPDRLVLFTPGNGKSLANLSAQTVWRAA